MTYCMQYKPPFSLYSCVQWQQSLLIYYSHVRTSPGEYRLSRKLLLLERNCWCINKKETNSNHQIFTKSGAGKRNVYDIQWVKTREWFSINVFFVWLFISYSSKRESSPSHGKRPVANCILVKCLIFCYMAFFSVDCRTFIAADACLSKCGAHQPSPSSIGCDQHRL